MVDAARVLTHRSVSQFNQYERCPHAYYLSRVKKVWQRPAAWLPQGTAFHTAAEKSILENPEAPSLDLALGLFQQSYDADVTALCDETPNTNYWSASGPYRGGVDIERRFDIGTEQIEKWHGWVTSHPEERFWTWQGKPAVEVPFDTDLGGVRIKGFIDAVLQVSETELKVRDWKTGNDPGDDFQLGVYKVVIEELSGLSVPTGDYFMAGKQGKPARPTKPYDLSEWTREAVTEQFRRLDDDIRAERFDPMPTPNKCRFCDVSASCEFSLG